MEYLQTEDTAHDDGEATSSALDEDARIESLKIALKGWFEQHQDMRCFLAVDPSQRDLLDDDDADDKGPFANMPRSDVVIGHEAFPEAHSPYLLELNLSTPAGVEALVQSIHIAFEDRRPESMAAGLGQRVGGWLASPASLEEVSAHWSRLVLQRDESGRACVLRFYDSRALALLWTVLSHTQQQTMLGPVRAWHVLDANARPTVHLASRDSHSDFMLSSTQWHEIHRHGLINRALALHAQRCCRQPDPGEIQVAIAAAARTELYGLIDRDDAMAFIGHALAWHPQFDLHTKISQLLTNGTAGDFYTSRIGELSGNEIDEIRQGSWHEHLLASTPGNTHM